MHADDDPSFKRAIVAQGGIAAIISALRVNVSLTATVPEMACFALSNIAVGGE